MMKRKEEKRRRKELGEGEREESRFKYFFLGSEQTLYQLMGRAGLRDEGYKMKASRVGHQE
jgi:hypothetical protein